MRPDPVLGLLGLAQKAGCIKSGEFMAENMIKEGKSFLCITATDASDNTKKQFSNMCEFYEVPMVVYGNKDTLGHFIGTQMRANIAITDEGIANSILKSVHNGK